MNNVLAQIPEVIIERQIRPRLIHGGFAWAVCFRLPKPAEEDGYIIQEITQQEGGTQIEKGETKIIPLRLTHYWEAWEVKKGETEPWQKQTINSFLSDNLGQPPTENTDFDIPMNDIFFRQYKVGAKGDYYISGLAGFYHGELPPDFIVNHPETGAKALKSTRKEPDFWTHNGFHRSFRLGFTYKTDAEWRDDSKQSWNTDRGRILNMSFADNFFGNLYKQLETQEKR